ncbi:TPA: hypothetical protein ACGO0V_000174 [Streptococcus suis]
MKTFISKLMLVSTVVLLAACQSIQTKEDETSNTSSSSQVTTSSDNNLPQSLPQRLHLVQTHKPKHLLQILRRYRLCTSPLSIVTKPI